MEYLNDSTCASCGKSGNGNFCANCGQPYSAKQITTRELFHDVFHLFTHLDKGFLYTLKLLFTAPGDMQRDYTEGNRSRYQKPFSMFFICATFAALVRYWISETLMHYFETGNASESDFIHEYMVLLQLLLIPVYVFITWLAFSKSGYNFAETVVMILYTLSFFCIAAALISLLKFIWHDLDTAYIELPVFLLYNIITLNRFYTATPKWLTAVKGIVIFVLIFLGMQAIENILIDFIFS